MWVTVGEHSPTPADAERCLGRGWRVIGEAWVRSTGEEANHKEDIWEECTYDSLGARQGWKLVDTEAEIILVDGSQYLNPHHGGVTDTGKSLTHEPVAATRRSSMSLEDFERLDPARQDQ